MHIHNLCHYSTDPLTTRHDPFPTASGICTDSPLARHPGRSPGRMLAGDGHWSLSGQVIAATGGSVCADASSGTYQPVIQWGKALATAATGAEKLPPRATTRALLPAISSAVAIGKEATGSGNSDVRSGYPPAGAVSDGAVYHRAGLV